MASTTDSATLLLKDVTFDLLRTLLTESSANQILTFNDSPPSRSSYVPSATPSVRPPLYSGNSKERKWNLMKRKWQLQSSAPTSCCQSTKNAFFNVLFCRQKRITEKGRHILKPNSLSKTSNVFMCHFKDCNYEYLEWPIASTEHNIFCWPCLRSNTSKGTVYCRPMDFIYKWPVNALLFDEYCIMHIVMEVYVVSW